MWGPSVLVLRLHVYEVGPGSEIVPHFFLFSDEIVMVGEVIFLRGVWVAPSVTRPTFDFS